MCLVIERYKFFFFLNILSSGLNLSRVVLLSETPSWTIAGRSRMHFESALEHKMLLEENISVPVYTVAPCEKKVF